MHWFELQIAVRNTLLVGAGSVLIAVPLGTLLAILLLRTNVAGSCVAWLMIASQLVVPLYVFAGGWSAGFGTLGWWPLAPANLQMFELVSLLAVLFIHAVAAIPWVCLIVSLGLVWSRRSLEELAAIEGGWWVALRRVTLPGLRPWIELSCVWTVVPVLTEMVVTNLYQVPTLPEQVYLDISLSGTSSWTYVAGGLGCVLPLCFLGVLVSRRIPGWEALNTNSNHSVSRQPIHDLRLYRTGVTLFVWALVIGLVGIPIGNLLYKAGWETVANPTLGASHLWTLRRLLSTASETLFGFVTEAYWTGMLAASAATLALMLGAACATVAFRRSARPACWFMCILLIAVPGPLAGQWTTFLLNSSSWSVANWLYDRTLLAPVLAQQFRLFPIAFLLSSTILASIDRRTWELARLDSLSPIGRLTRIVLPQTGSRWAVAWIMLAAFSAGELSTNLLVLPPGVTTVAQRLFELLHFGMRYQDSGLCLALFVVGWLVALTAWKTRKGFQ